MANGPVTLNVTGPFIFLPLTFRFSLFVFSLLDYFVHLVNDIVGLPPGAAPRPNFANPRKMRQNQTVR
jgi:hypothetical protein